MKLALAMIVKGSDDEAVLLQRCLGNMEKYVDGIYITRTHKKGEKPNKKVGEVAKRFKAHLSDFEWVYDFSKARNYNFSQVPKDFDYIMWSDADDIWRGLEKLRPTLEKHPHMDAFGFNYLYDWDEFKKPTVVHRKTMIVRNDGCVKWAGAIHEDFQELRSLEIFMIQGVERLHISTKERYEMNAERNLEIAERESKVKSDDPRSSWNLGNAQIGVAKYKDAADAFTKFLNTSSSDDEKYLVHERISDVYRMGGDAESAVRHLQLAIGLQPSLPDAFLNMAHLYYTIGNMDKAEEYSIQGLMRRPQVQKMIVYNPRDYDYNPMMLLAKVYYQKNRPDLMLPLLKGCLKIYPEDEHLKSLVKEGEAETKALEKALKKVKVLEGITDMVKLKKQLDALPPDVRSHPAIAVIRNKNFIKKESSGKDMVIYCGNTSHIWNPELFKTKGFGGSEEAVIHMAKEFAKIGWNVIVYNNCGHKRMKIDGVEYAPFWEWNYRDKQDVTIIWRWTKPFDAEINSTKVFLDLHDVVPPGEFTEKRLARINKIFVKSRFHRSLFPNVPDNKIEIIPNGFETYADPTIKKDPYLVLNTSSPDRSMDVLPGLFQRVKKQVPKAHMKWAYGWDVYKAAFSGDSKKLEWMKKTNKAMDDAGIEQTGKLPQAEVAKLYQQATVLAYPTEFAEIDCISVKKAQAVKCIPVATDFGALKESIKYGVKVKSKKTKDNWNKPYQFHFGLENPDAQTEWVNEVVAILKGKIPIGWSGLDQWVSGFEWSKIAKRWDATIRL